MMRRIIFMWLAMLLAGCHSKKHVVTASEETVTADIVATEQVDTSKEASATSSINMILDSLDVWVYTFNAADSAPAGKAVHFAARKLVIGRNDSISTSTDSTSKNVEVAKVGAHEREASNSEAETTAGWKPGFWAYFFGAAMLIIVAIYFRNRSKYTD